MTDRQHISSKARFFFDDLWMRGDPWELETSDFERERYARLIGILDQPKYVRILEIGCGAGAFTRLLAPRAERLLALDVSGKAVERARAAHGDLSQVEFRVANIMDYNLKEEGPWDLIIMSETIYLLGWLYSFFDICWLASELFAATRHGGQLLLANAQGEVCGPLLHPSIIRTYHDLLPNVGYVLKTEETLRGQKNGVDLEVLISLFCKVNAMSSDTGS
jgi:SAM-dependent methyltransferase